MTHQQHVSNTQGNTNEVDMIKVFSKVHSKTCNALIAVKTHLPHTHKKKNLKSQCPSAFTQCPSAFTKITNFYIKNYKLLYKSQHIE